ncbi:hypothetical protein RRG08_009864 [Elysia crispata]|uniref:Uncharacterized protein n=1 Tax=Elysia crispata TaxID=231223 RepID=A0AAE0Z5K1_9GAST|nr:hypothetical protein RRG08_009864 [Elysia crispata]
MQEVNSENSPLGNKTWLFKVPDLRFSLPLFPSKHKENKCQCRKANEISNISARSTAHQFSLEGFRISEQKEARNLTQTHVTLTPQNTSPAGL